MKTNIEYELLEIRQDLWDGLQHIKNQKTVDMIFYQKVLFEIRKCNVLLKKLRYKAVG